MLKQGYRSLHLLGIFCFLTFSFSLFTSCNEHAHIGEKEIVEKPEDINVKAEEVIQGTLKDVLQNNKDISDSFKLKNASVVQHLYDEYSFQPLWSAQGKFSPWSDSLFSLIDSSYKYGLFPQDYYHQKLAELRNELKLDTSKEVQLDAAKWAYSDLLLTSAFVQLVKDLSKGRLLPDSILVKDSLLTPEFYTTEFNQFKKAPVSEFTSALEPRHAEYKNLKQSLHKFLEKADFKEYTLIKTKDSTQIPALVYKRLSEDDSLLQEKNSPDSATVAAAIKKFQKKHGLKANGKISPALINKLNDTDKEKFIRIAISLDKWKMLQPLPEQYIWVNIPSFYLQVKDSDTVVLTSRIVVGKPETKTPIITSAITDMITYPKWTIPESIIKKEILPGLKKDPGYTLRKGYTLFDKDGNEIDPYTVSWSKFKEGIPYNVVQGSGDENALGVMKFNFPNKHSVYLHDTNQRYLFSKSSRALSHGCVRVQAWQQLSNYILRNDSAYSEKAIPVDTVSNWLTLKEKHVIPVRKKLPLFIRYFTCEGKDDKVVFYEDVYGEDRRIREQTFSAK
jgi:L,D-transpeptidase YcbB